MFFFYMNSLKYSKLLNLYDLGQLFSVLQLKHIFENHQHKSPTHLNLSKCVASLFHQYTICKYNTTLLAKFFLNLNITDKW